jgi:predicted NUDIX family NTP pyrophosphohydrolase
VPERSAGILLWRRADGDSAVEVLIAHMGGPHWRGQHEAAWSVPKGLYDESEAPLDAALREFAEELGLAVPVTSSELVPLGELRQPSGKRLVVWAGEGDLDVTLVQPGTFTMPWPPRSATLVEFPEIDEARWCGVDEARVMLVKGQRPFLDRLLDAIR